MVLNFSVKNSTSHRGHVSERHSMSSTSQHSSPIYLPRSKTLPNQIRPTSNFQYFNPYITSPCQLSILPYQSLNQSLPIKRLVPSLPMTVGRAGHGLGPSQSALRESLPPPEATATIESLHGWEPWLANHDESWVKYHLIYGWNIVRFSGYSRVTVQDIL